MQWALAWVPWWCWDVLFACCWCVIIIMNWSVGDSKVNYLHTKILDKYVYILCLHFQLTVEEDEWDAIELAPNIIMNPGFYEHEDPNDLSPPYTRTIIFGEDVLSSSESESSEEEQMTFKRKVSLFFTGDTIKRLWVRTPPVLLWLLWRPSNFSIWFFVFKYEHFKCIFLENHRFIIQNHGLSITIAKPKRFSVQQCCVYLKSIKNLRISHLSRILNILFYNFICISFIEQNKANIAISTIGIVCSSGNDDDENAE